MFNSAWYFLNHVRSTLKIVRTKETFFSYCLNDVTSSKTFQLFPTLQCLFRFCEKDHPVKAQWIRSPRCGSQNGFFKCCTVQQAQVQTMSFFLKRTVNTKNELFAFHRVYKAPVFAVLQSFVQIVPLTGYNIWSVIFSAQKKFWAGIQTKVIQIKVSVSFSSA